MVPVLSWSDNPRMFIESKRNLRLERQTRPFYDDLRAELSGHVVLFLSMFHDYDLQIEGIHLKSQYRLSLT
jgi:hypothetical protein